MKALTLCGLGVIPSTSGVLSPCLLAASLLAMLMEWLVPVFLRDRANSSSMCSTGNSRAGTSKADIRPLVISALRGLVESAAKRFCCILKQKHSNGMEPPKTKPTKAMIHMGNPASSVSIAATTPAKGRGSLNSGNAMFLPVVDLLGALVVVIEGMGMGVEGEVGACL